MKFECFSSVTFFKEKTTLSHIPTTIEPNVWFIPVVMLYGENYIGKETFVQNSTLMKVFIGENCLIENSEIVRSSIKNDCGIGGASVIDSEIDERAMIGRGVVIDEAIIGAGVRLPHACQIVHCIIDQNTKISFGACINGHNSSSTELIYIGKNCFIGANVIMNSSCLIGNEVYISDGAILSHDAHIPDHAWIAGYGRDCYAKPNCSFYMGKGLWMVTKKPTEPKLMEEIGEELHLYDTTVAFHCRLQKDDYREWLTSTHPRLNNFRPIDLLKEEAQYESTTGAVALKKLIQQEIESLSLDDSSPPQ